MTNDRSLIICESYPGAMNDLAVHVEARGGWICEQHPHLLWPHDGCEAPGMLKEPTYDPS